MDLIKKYRLNPLDQYQEFSNKRLSDLDMQIQDIKEKKKLLMMTKPNCMQKLY